MKATKDTVTISKLRRGLLGPAAHTVQLKDADPNELQLLIDKMPATINGKSVRGGPPRGYSRKFWIGVCREGS